MLDMILLGYLADGPRSGYDLKLLLETDSAHFWHAHHSQIYTTLRRLERRGLIRSRKQAARGLQERRVYTLAAAGRDALETWRDLPLLAAAPPKDAALARIFFAGPQPARDLLPELRRLRSARRDRLTELKRRPSIPAPSDPDDLRPLTRAYARAVEALTIRWLDELIARLESTGARLESTGARLESTGARLESTGARLESTGARRGQAKTKPRPTATRPKRAGQGRS